MRHLGLSLSAALVALAASSSPPVGPDSTEQPGTEQPGTVANEPVPADVVVPIGTSVEGRPIEALRRGDPEGRRVVVIGVIHGDENDGVAIVDRLAVEPVPEGIDLYLVEAMNPDGYAADIRHNANGVDLNRNFPYDWAPIAEPGNWEYAGTGPASEPETQAMVTFLAELEPDIVIWYHQDLFMIAPGEGRAGDIRARYAELTGLPLESASGGTYTGVAAVWARQELADNPGRPGVAFIVELGPTLSAAEADTHAAAVATILAEDR